MWFLFGALLAAGGVPMSARAQSNVVYAVEYNQSTNRFGTIDLLSGNFTKIASFGSMLINDIAYCPTNGTLYGISNTTALVTFNKTNGAITRVGSLSVSGIESLAFRYSDGALFGATSSKLYTVNPANGTATLVGNYGSPINLGTTGQNIRFAQDGNLYVSNTSTNTDIYRINTTNGAATRMGQAVGFPYLMLQNASSNMYGVFINLGSGASNATPELVTLNLSSFVNGGTNANGSTHPITVTMVGAGTNFPPNFNFSGNVPQVVTNLTVPVSASGPSNQTAVVGSNVVFSTVASGTGPYNYAWLKNGVAISSQTNSSLTLNTVTTNDAAAYSVIVGGVIGTVTNSATLTVNVPVTVTVPPANQTVAVGNNVTFSVTATGTGLSYQWLFNGSVIGTSNSLTLNNVTTSQAGIYTVIVIGAAGSVTNSATLTVNKAVATITLGSLSQTYTGTAEAATATTTPSGLAVTFTYNGSANAPTNAGSYTVIGTINNSNYQGSATGTLVIAQAGATVTLGNLNQIYSGSAEAATATTTPTGLAVTFTYNGSANAPTNAGSYTVIGTINNPNYTGGATNTLVISQASGAVTLGSLNQTYNGTAKPATASTTPSGLAVTLTYNGSVNAPTNTGSYTVIGTINNPNYTGSATNTLVISQASGAVTLGNLNQTYNGTAKPATASTTPSGLAVTLTYNGSANAPTNAGSYTVIGTINDANYQGSATNTLVIGQASGAITLGSLSQTYTGTAKPATASTTPSGLTVTLTYNGSVNAPTSAGSYTVIGTINDANYQGSATNTLVIAQASGAVSLGSLNHIYDGTAKAATATTTPSGLAVTLTYNGSANAPTNAGSYTVIGTINDANYQGSATNTLVINKATLTYTANAASMTYGSAVPVLSGLVSGFVGTDNQGNATTGTLTFTTTATSSSGVGGYAINGAGLTANGNYSLVQAAGNAAALTINALPVNLTGSRSYDGTTTVAAEFLSVANKVGSDNVTVASGSGTLVGANVGSEAIMSFGNLALGGTAAVNYTLGSASGSVNITVSALALTVTNLLAVDKVYDGNTNATLDATAAGLTGVLNGDDVTLVSSNVVAYFADKNADTNKPVTVTGLALVGTAAANYTLVDPTNLTANITAAGLTVNGVAAASKVYDGTTNAQLNGPATLNGAASGDDVSLVTDSASAAFASPNAGTGIPVTVSGYAITGADAGNYTLTQPSGLAADITAATLTITATVNTKIYDGTTSAAAIPTTSGLQGSDIVTGLAETYDTPNAGTGKTLSVSAYVVNDGNSGNNYTVGTVTSTAGVINKASSSISLGNLSQTYSGTAKAATATTIPTGLAVSLTYNGSATIPINAGSYTVIGTINDANYQGSATNTLLINKGTLTVTADNKTKIYGMSNPPLTAGYNGFVGGENTNVLSSPVVLKTTATNTSDAGVYPITVSGAAAANYTIQYVNGTLQVIAAPQLASATTSVNGNEQFIVSWQTITNQTYQLEYSDDLNTFIWTPVGTPLAGTDGIVAITNSMSVTPHRFYRVEVLAVQ